MHVDEHLDTRRLSHIDRDGNRLRSLSKGCACLTARNSIAPVSCPVWQLTGKPYSSNRFPAAACFPLPFDGFRCALPILRELLSWWYRRASRQLFPKLRLDAETLEDPGPRVAADLRKQQIHQLVTGTSDSDPFLVGHTPVGELAEQLEQPVRASDGACVVSAHREPELPDDLSFCLHPVILDELRFVEGTHRQRLYFRNSMLFRSSSTNLLDEALVSRQVWLPSDKGLVVVGQNIALLFGREFVECLSILPCLTEPGLFPIVVVSNDALEDHPWNLCPLLVLPHVSKFVYQP